MSGYGGEGTGVDGVDGVGTGWGGFSAGDTAQFGTPDAPVGVGGPASSGGKPGESAMAQAGAINATGRSGPMSNQELADAGISVGGRNPVNAEQTTQQMENASRLNSALSFGLPIAASMFAPAGFGAAMMLGKVGSKVMNGQPIFEAIADILPGVINGKINQVTGGILGKAGMVSSLSGYMGGPTMPNIGREIVGGIIGRQSGGSNTGAGYAAQPGTSPVAEGNGDTAQQTGMAAAPGAAQRAPAQPAAQQPDFDYASLGIDSAGWTRAGRKYREAKNGMV